MIKYPEDAEMKQRISIIREKYKHLPVDVFTKEVRRATSTASRRDDVKKILISSYSNEKGVTGEYNVDISSEDACIRSYKELEQLIRSDKRNILLHSAYQGHMLKHLKTNMKNKGSFIKCLFDKEISISLSHCNFLIAFFELAEKYPNICQCSLELRFFTKHFKIVKEVVPEVFSS